MLRRLPRSVFLLSAWVTRRRGQVAQLTLLSSCRTAFSLRASTRKSAATELLSELPDSPQLHDLLARIYIDKGNLDLAIAHAETAVRLLRRRGDTTTA